MVRGVDIDARGRGSRSRDPSTGSFISGRAAAARERLGGTVREYILTPIIEVQSREPGSQTIAIRRVPFEGGAEALMASRDGIYAATGRWLLGATERGAPRFVPIPVEVEDVGDFPIISESDST